MPFLKDPVLWTKSVVRLQATGLKGVCSRVRMPSNFAEQLGMPAGRAPVCQSVT